jgi:hypothetical protein
MAPPAVFPGSPGAGGEGGKYRRTSWRRGKRGDEHRLLGATSRLVGLTGIDDAARALSKALADVNVKCDFVSVPTHPTITKLLRAVAQPAADPPRL